MSEQRPRKLPTNLAELFPGRFLKAELFRKRPVTLQIKAIYMEDLIEENGQKKSKGIVAFEKTEMELVINKTNALIITALWGKNPQDWVGHRVTLACEGVRFGPQRVDAIRVIGSPDISEPVDVEIKHPRRAAVSRRIYPTGQRQSPQEQPPPDRQPGEDEELEFIDDSPEFESGDDAGLVE